MTNETKYDFCDGNGPVAAHQHSNGGGWVADTAKVADTAYVGPDAKVHGNAKVYGYANVSGYAMVSGNAVVYGNAQVFANAQVSGNALVSKFFPQSIRSDGYTFVYVPMSDGLFHIQTGCRNMTIDEYMNHINTYDCEKKKKETLLILEFLKAQNEVLNLD